MYPAMPKRRGDAPEYTRVNAYVQTSLVAKIDETLGRLRREGVSSSYSALVQIALAELVDRRDLAAVLRRHGAKARRD
jgi:hypothetical protein